MPETGPPGDKVQREAQQAAIHHRGPTADRYADALEKYVGAVLGDEPPAAPQEHTYPAQTVSDVMSREVVTVQEETPFKDIVRLIEHNHVNGVPVVGPDRSVVGMVTASDLLARFGVPRPVPRGHRLGAIGGTRRKRRATTARGLMTTPAITVAPQTPITEAARLAARVRVQSLPVVDRGGRLLGIVTRGDLVTMFLRSDEQIRRDVEHDVVRRPGHHAHGPIRVEVQDGVVTMSGAVASALEAERLAGAAMRVAGVVEVVNDLAFDVDDTLLPRHV